MTEKVIRIPGRTTKLIKVPEGTITVRNCNPGVSYVMVGWEKK